LFCRRDRKPLLSLSGGSAYCKLSDAHR
jgi:hypothetical protein